MQELHDMFYDMALLVDEQVIWDVHSQSCEYSFYSKNSGNPLESDHTFCVQTRLSFSVRQISE